MFHVLAEYLTTGVFVMPEKAPFTFVNLNNAFCDLGVRLPLPLCAAGMDHQVPAIDGGYEANVARALAQIERGGALSPTPGIWGRYHGLPEDDLPPAYDSAASPAMGTGDKKKLVVDWSSSLYIASFAAELVSELVSEVPATVWRSGNRVALIMVYEPPPAPDAIPRNFWDVPEREREYSEYNCADERVTVRRRYPEEIPPVSVLEKLEAALRGAVLDRLEGQGLVDADAIDVDVVASSEAVAFREITAMGLWASGEVVAVVATIKVVDK